MKPQLDISFHATLIFSPYNCPGLRTKGNEKLPRFSYSKNTKKILSIALGHFIKHKPLISEREIVKILNSLLTA